MVKINGKEMDIAGQNLLDYLKEAGYRPERVVVERNLEILAREDLGSITIEEEDTIEVLEFMGGG
ncbi:MAG: sulfur carrier protein ThiS [Lachnospiraceae bacterium]|nr:sulfur carrier protein ThiS [Lachnospiraceae bacterium]HCJ08563.1 thiamine biosynthesis protein ThiS [Lachnospiraceae bacterium]